ncbi:MAG: endonuclease/exonuclease/phosphatase family protein [Lunatimonas sp.]|uniref:endonuclease/exonuclease/phosphatase family protein n=1 Tax=Lunatimonas sp. TaxID=2060141 RepID=UPI00263AF4FA|nr:endonuclease/exonuclease/phosphatase family protein [Lunatimonas sp.]MCC5937591.1 endonuclease/exonuclease/phosphatase family protein [Lunatimonas sp.]
MNFIKSTYCLFLGLFAFAFGVQAQSVSLKVATFNIRYANPGDDPDTWENRRQAAVDLIRFHEFDIFGIQEGLHAQVKDLERMLPGFAYVGVGRDDGAEKGEYSCIFYHAGKYDVLDSGTFWLAEDTTKPNKGWDAALPRIVTWAKFKDKATGDVFFHFNTHFDHRGWEARVQSAQLILKKVAELSDPANPVIVTGDFNVDQDSDPYKVMRDAPGFSDTHDVARIRYANNGTFNSFDNTKSSDKRIDHIFVNDKIKVKRYGILTDTYHNRYPSDHFPVMAEIYW